MSTRLDSKAALPTNPRDACVTASCSNLTASDSEGAADSVCYDVRERVCRPRMKLDEMVSTDGDVEFVEVLLDGQTGVGMTGCSILSPGLQVRRQGEAGAVATSCDRDSVRGLDTGAQISGLWKQAVFTLPGASCSSASHAAICSILPNSTPTMRQLLPDLVIQRSSLACVRAYTHSPTRCGVSTNAKAFTHQ